MQANRNQRLSENKPGQRAATASRQTVVTAVSVLILGVFAWLMLRDNSDVPPLEPVAEVTAPAPVAPSGPLTPMTPDIPVTVKAPPQAEVIDLTADVDDEAADVDDEASDDSSRSVPEDSEPPLEPPLTFGNSDVKLREHLGEAFSDGVPGTVLRNANLVERSAAAIDSIRRGLVPDKLLNLQRPQQAFKVRTQNGQTAIDPDSYRRYDAIVTSLVEAPVAPVVSAFQRFRWLLEDAYGALGYPPEDMDNALIAALDQIQATPVIDGVLSVERDEAVWVFTRQDLESLSLLQKQLLRAGPDNVRKLKEKARVLREALLNP